jgi:AcrR family transcriptional regulator
MAVTSAREGDAAPASSRDRLLTAIGSRFAVSGFAGTRLVDVAEDVDLTTGAFYSYFAGKAAAFHVLFDRFAAELTGELVGATNLTDYCERWIECHRTHLGTVRAAEEVAHEDPSFLAHLARYRQLWAGSAMSHLPAGLDTGTMRTTANLTVDILEYYFFTVGQGWSKSPPAAVARNLSALIGSGLYLRDAEGVAPPERPSRGEGPSEPNPLGLMSWSAARGRVEPNSRRGVAQRAAILEAATRVFGELGYNNSAIGAIAAQAGVSPATVYRYFSDKNDIFRSLLSTVRDELYGTALIYLDEDGRMVVEPVVLQFLKVRREYAAVYRVWRELLEPGSEMEEAWVWIRRDFQNGVARIVGFGQRNGLISGEFDPELVAELAVAAFDGPSHSRFDLGWDEGVVDGEFACVMGAVFGMGLGAGE